MQQFVNAVLEQDSSKLDRVAIIRLCGPYSRGSPPFVDFPTRLAHLMKGYVGYVDGGYQGMLLAGVAVVNANDGFLGFACSVLTKFQLMACLSHH